MKDEGKLAGFNFLSQLQELKNSTNKIEERFNDFHGMPIAETGNREF
jgi:hypothetical protein